MAIYKYNNPGVANANSASAFKAFLDSNKAGTFLEDLTISTSGTGQQTLLTITDGTNAFSHINFNAASGALAADRGYIRFTNGTVTDEISDNYYDGWLRCYIVGAMLAKNGLFINVAFDTADKTAAPTDANNNMVGAFMLTIDSDGKMCCIKKANTLLNRTITRSTNLRSIVHDSTAITVVNVSPTYNTQKTAIFPIVINTNSGNTTIPKFYTSLQTELPSLGLQAVQIELSNYITNGYCFIKDGV